MRAQANCTFIGKTIGVSNVIVHGETMVTLRPAAGSNAAALIIAADRVLIENFELLANGGTRFFTGIALNNGIDDVSIQNVTVNSATTTAGMKFSSSGRNVCVRDATVTGAGVAPANQNGYFVEDDPTGANGTIEFRMATASSNTEDGFSVRHPSDLASLKFLRTESRFNDGDGYDVSGTQVELLCAEASNNSNPGRGVVWFGSGELHIENAHVVDNEGVGIHGGNADLRVISSTVADNDVLEGQQIAGSNVSVFTTIGQGRQFVAIDSSPACGGNLCRSTGGTCCAGGCCTEAAVAFESSSKMFLTSSSPGVDSTSGDPRSFTSLVRIAGTRDYLGTSRPQDGNVPQDGISRHDVGAFERTPPPPVPTPTRTKTPTFTRTPSVTRTFTPRNTRTPTAGCADCPCHGDCDCDGLVKINELVGGVNLLLADGVCPCFDADANGRVTIGEIVRAVKNSLEDCPAGGGASLPQTVTVDVGTASGLPGAAVTVPINISGGAGLVAGAQVDILFDQAVLSIANPASDCVLATRLGSQQIGASLPASPPAPTGKRRLRVVVYPSFTSIAAFTDGEIASCTFAISSSAAPATYPLQAERQAVSDADGNSFNTTADNGAVTVCGGCGCS